MAAQAGHPALVIHLLPVRGGASDLFARAGALLVACEARPVSAAPSADLLDALYDLTPAEARLARALAGGESLGCLTERFGVSRSTLRSQLARVFDKTGTSRQAELVGLLGAIQLGHAAPAPGEARAGTP